MISFKKIICLLSFVVAVASEDQYDECALVNELVEQGEVSGTELQSIPSFVIFCKAFLTCSTNRWADTAATVQPNW